MPHGFPLRSFLLVWLATTLLAVQPAMAGDADSKWAPVKPSAAKLAPIPQAKPSANEPPIATDPVYAAFDEGRYMEALKLATDAAGRGEPQAATLIGKLYEQGLGVVKDEKKGAEWYARGAALGDADAQFALGMMLLHGRGVARDTKKAASLLEQAAAKNNALAQYNLALVYVEGAARPGDYVKIAELLEKSAYQDNAQAQYDLATLYRTGQGVPQDSLKAAQWMGRAAQVGLTDAQLEYGIMLMSGKDGVVKNERAGAEYLMIAAEKGNPVAQNRLARAYLWGLGVSLDPVLAAKWHIISRSAGESDGRLDLLLTGLSKEQREQAEQQAADWQKQHNVF